MAGQLTYLRNHLVVIITIITLHGAINSSCAPLPEKRSAPDFYSDDLLVCLGSMNFRDVIENSYPQSADVVCYCSS